MAVYDEEDKKTDSKPASDDQLRHITGINKEQEAAHDREAHRGATQDKHDSGNKSKRDEGDSKQEGKAKAVGDQDDTVGRGYNAASKLPGPAGLGARVGGFLFGTKTRRNSTIFGSVIALLIGGFGIYSFFSLDSFEFEQIDHLMQQLHLQTQQDESNDRVSKLLRDIRAAKQGKFERTNMGVIGNVMADKVEKLLNDQGLESAYSKYLGLKEGYFVDTSKGPFEGKDFEDVKNFVHDNMGENINVTKTGDGRIFIEQPNGFSDALNINKFVLTEGGVNKVSAGVYARIMAQRDGAVSLLHPWRKLDSKVFKTIKAQLAEWQKEDTEEVKNGATTAQIEAQEHPDQEGSQQAQQQAKQNAGDAAKQANQTIDEGKTAGQGVDAGNTGPITAFTNHISVKIGLGGASAAAVLCLARGLASQASGIKQDQVALPLVRTGVRSLASGEQAEYGKSDIDPQQVQQDGKKLYDPSNRTTWFDAQSIQAGLGHPNTGIPPSATLQNLGKGTPFDFLLTGAFNAVLAPVCSAGGQAALTIVSFLGGPVSALASLVAGAAIGPPIISALAHWLAGDAANLEAQGADLGSNIDFGVHLLAKDQGISSGMPALTTAQATQVSMINQQQMQQQFDQHSFAYKLLSPTDSRTYLASVMDRISPSIAGDISNALYAVINIKGSIANIFSSVFSHETAHAATNAPYPYGGVPYYAFTPGQMDNSLVEHPFQNADIVADILSGPSGGMYIDRAAKCFGDTLTQVPGPNGTQVWDVQYGTSPINTFDKTYKDLVQTCSNLNDLNWLRVCFFIFDTQNIKALDCYLGGTSTSTQSCTDVGMTNAT